MDSGFNPYAFYGIEECFFPDEPALRATFLELSRKHHPDYFPYDSAEHREAMSYADLNNRAYRILSSFEDRLHWILTHHGLLQEGEKNIMPAGFLNELLELNDLIDEAHAGDATARAQAEEFLQIKIKELKEEMHLRARTWDKNPEHALLAELHRLYQQYRYLGRLEQNFIEGVE